MRALVTGSAYADLIISRDKEELVGVIIESNVFASGFRQMFEVLWSMTIDITA
jgi:hypothetical protein